MYRFHNSKVDTDLFMQLQDLSSVLTENEKTAFEYSFGSYIDIIDNKVTASRMWDTAKEDYKEVGFKSDVFLRTIGSFHYSSTKAMKEYLELVQETDLKKFSSQLFALLEDIRLEEIIKKNVPVPKRYFLSGENT